MRLTQRPGNYLGSVYTAGKIYYALSPLGGGAIEPADRLACVEISTYPLAASIRPRLLKATLSLPATKLNRKRIRNNGHLPKTMLAIASKTRSSSLRPVDPIVVIANIGEGRRRGGEAAASAA